MTDPQPTLPPHSTIPILEQAVITAARKLVKTGDDNARTREEYKALCVAVDALDTALKPDPWQLLVYAKGHIDGTYPDNIVMLDVIDDALAWRLENPNV